ncbi:MAG: twin-arginine translocase subunit TatC, partial [Gammaproteobacteria bacterium]|nr:twin-arginine translocase subunit TatC [Gammaproteobacteria bacterium]
LRRKRPYIIVAAFVVGMLLTPPDIISQTLLAVPVWMLFELGVVFSGWFVAMKKDDNESPDADGSESPLSEDAMDAELDRIEAEEENR